MTDIAPPPMSHNAAMTHTPRLTKLLVLGACALTPWVGALAWNLWERVRVWPMKP